MTKAAEKCLGVARQVLVEEQKTRGTRVRVASSPVSLGSDCEGLGSDKRLPVMIDLSLNQRIADKLREAADLLEQQAANPFRVSAYRHAADTVVGLQRDLRQLVEAEGLKGLTKLPTIGHGIAAAIHELITTGRWSQLERLRGTLDPAHLFQTIPGVSANAGATPPRHIECRYARSSGDGGPSRKVGSSQGYRSTPRSDPESFPRQYAWTASEPKCHDP